MKKFCPALLVWFLSLAGVNESVRPQVGSTTGSQVEVIPSEEDEPAQEATRAESGLYFPDYVDGGGWSVQLALSNVARRVPAAVAVTAYDQDGQPLPELFDSETTFEIPPLGSQVLRSVGTGEIRRGWIEVRSVPPAVSGLLTYRHSGSGVEVGVAPVPLGDRFALFVEESSEIGTGLAIFKPEADSEVEFRLHDEAGADPFGQDLTLGDFQQQALTLPEWFNPIGATFPGDFRGLLFLRSGEDASFAPLGLRFGKRKDSLSAVPGIRFLGEGGGGAPNPFQTTTSTAGPLYFPDYVDGGGWSVQLVLGNLDPDRSVPVEVEVYDQQGRSVNGLFDSETRFELPAQGSQVLKSAGGTRIRRGWIKVEADSASVRGLLVYRNGETGIEVGVAPVEPRDEFALFVEESSEIGTGLALFKPQVNSKVEFRIRDEAGNDPLGDVYVPWRNFRQSARTLSEWLDVDGVDAGFLKDFRGLLFLRTEDGSEFAPLGLRFGKGTSALSAVPGIGIVDGVRIAGGVGSDGGVEIDGGVGIDGGGMAPPPTVTLSVSPSSIDRGQSATLRWSSTNADSVEITPDVGNVSTSGTRNVSPRTTTTYRITVTAADGQTATTSVTVTVAITDRAVLEALYEATGGANWNESTNWLTDAPLEEWHGVEVDVEGRVVSLNLHSNNMTGSIPPELGGLDHLEILYMAANNLAGPIPAELGMLTNLETLDLEFNPSLDGSIPSELGSLKNLRDLQLRRNDLSGPIPPELGNLTNLVNLELGWSKLSGPIPTELGNLRNLVRLILHRTNLTGTIPSKIGELARLRTLWVFENAGMSGALPLSLSHLALDDFRYGDTSLCVPDSASFRTWLGNVRHLEETGLECALVNKAPLEALYRATGGTGWADSGNWLTDAPLGQWYGVEVDASGQIVSLDLSSNNLTGSIPSSLADLAGMTALNLMDNSGLAGRLPLSLANLPLKDFNYSGTDLCVLRTATFHQWLNGIATHSGTGLACEASNRDILEVVYSTTGGRHWDKNDNWLTDAPLWDWYGVEVDDEERVVSLELWGNGLTGSISPDLAKLENLRSLSLNSNRLTGSIPPEIGDLAQLQYLSLSRNDLSGAVPSRLGDLTNLRYLSLDYNDLAGLIPSEIGNFPDLRVLRLDNNDLSGTIPSQLGDLSNLGHLYLHNNDLSGTIPSQLGDLSNLMTLDLHNNDLSGTIPSQLGDLSNLVTLDLYKNDLRSTLPSALSQIKGLERLAVNHNGQMSGTVADGFTGLRKLEGFHLDGTDLCVPPTAEFQEWLNAIPVARAPVCGNTERPFYLTQSVQSMRFPVPLVAAKDALLRVFVAAKNAGNYRIPRIRATFFQRGRNGPVHVADIPAQPHPIPAEVNESDLSASANALIPESVVAPGLEMVVDVDPDKTLDPALGITRRIPAEGRTTVDVRTVPTLDLTVVPLQQIGDADRSFVNRVAALTTDHDTFANTQKLLPVGEFKLTIREPLMVSNPPIARYCSSFLPIIEAVRVAEGSTGHYVGIVTGGGIAYLGGRSAVSNLTSATMAHELGHTMSLDHAPCGGAGFPDPLFPYAGGATGAWGYDFGVEDLMPPTKRDIMGYCFSQSWISDYFFTKAMIYRMRESDQTAAATSRRSLLVWGGVDADGKPHLHPAFVVDAPPTLPVDGGPFRVVGQDEHGEVLFSMAFAMPEVADGDGESSFVFAVPASAEWEDALDIITLTAPGGISTLGREGDHGTALLRDPVTGRVRGILHDWPRASARQADTSGQLSEDVLEVQVSYGIPDGAAWRR